jgi:hypothetical protein
VERKHGSQHTMLEPGGMATVVKLPPGFLDDLPAEDQEAILAALGKPMTLLDIDSDGRAELEFTDRSGVLHFIYIDGNQVSR